MLPKAAAFLGILFAVAVHGESLPDPYANRAAPWIGPVPVPTMEQVFWLQVPGPADAAVTIELPQGVELVDRTKPVAGQRRPLRFYLRAKGPLHEAPVRVFENGKSAIVPLTVRSYREDVEAQLKNVPGVDYAVRKRGRSYYTPAILAVAEENLRQRPELAAQLRRPTPYSTLSDSQLFARLPSWNVPRNFYGNFPCPYCGTKIFAHSGFFPWKFDDAHPFKAQCPDCGRWFPSNDFAADDFTSGEFPDDGWGWDPGSGDRKRFAAWIGNYAHQQLWLNLGGHLRQLSLQYLLLHDKAAAHRTAILLARMAYVYTGMNMRWQLVDDTYSRPGRLLADGNWERKETLVPACYAYDAIFDAIDGDTELVDFLRAKDPKIRTTDDVKALIETCFIQVLGWDWIHREATGGNMGSRETDLVRMAVAANFGAMSDRWIEEVFTHAYNSGLNKGGYDDQVLTNMRTREGPTWISGPVYEAGYTRAVGEMAEALSHLAADSKWAGKVDLFNRALYPKVYSELETWTRFSVAGQYIPSWGDGIGPPGLRYATGILQGDSLRATYARAYARWHDDWLAQALARLGPGKPDLFQPDLWPQIKAQAERAGPLRPLPSRVFDGFGWVLLESRPEAAEPHARAGVALRYGYSRGHEHQDNLDIQVFARGLNLSPDLGYPTWAEPLGSTGHVAHHNTGMIDHSPQYRGREAPAPAGAAGNSLEETFASPPTARGTLQQFARLPGMSFAEVTVRPTGFPNREYRRAVALVDAPGGNVYVLDVFRMAGGAIRTYAMHGPPSDRFETSVPFSANGQPYFDVGAMPPNDRMKPNILAPRVAMSDGDVWADWRFMAKPDRAWQGASALGAPLSWPTVSGESHLRLHLLAEKGRRYVTADYGRPEVPGTHFVFAEDEAKDGASQFVAVWEPYDTTPHIAAIERVAVQPDGAATEFAPVAVRVHLRDGRVDTLVYTATPATALRLADGTEFVGRFGSWSEAKGQPGAVQLVDGARFLKAGKGIASTAPAFRSAIREADYDERWLRLDAAVPEDLGAPGTMLFISNGHRSAAYEIEDVSGDRHRVRLRHSAILYRGKIVDFQADARTVSLETEPPIETVTGFPPGYYDGATLTGDDGRSRYRVEHVDGAQVRLDRVPKPQDFPDLMQTGRQMARVYEFGPGDTVTLYRAEARTLAPAP